MGSNLASQDYWDSSYANLVFAIAAPDDAVRVWIESHVPRGQGRAFEVGCFPGRYLAVLGELGFELNGIDLTSRVQDDLPAWLRSRGYATGSFLKEDFMERANEEHFDIVCSFGFIEHFENWQTLLGKQCASVASGGLLLVSCPNFRSPVQHTLHRWLDRKNLERHFIPAMDPGLWADVVRSHGLTPIWSGYFGRYDFWVDEQERTTFQKLGLIAVRKARGAMRLLPPGKELYSPYCGLVAIRNA